MFRVVRIADPADPAFGEPAYFLLCDHKQCMEARKGAAVTTNPDDFRLSRSEFLKAAVAEGWWIDLEGGFCPVHAREMFQAAHAAKERASQIVPAQPGHVAMFGRHL